MQPDDSRRQNSSLGLETVEVDAVRNGRTAVADSVPFHFVFAGFVYRGAAIPNLVGGYLFGDECSGTLRVVGAGASTGVKPRIILESGKTIGSLGEDEAGELYVADIGGGTIWQVVKG